MKFGITMYISPPHMMDNQKLKKNENPSWQMAAILKV